MPSLPFPIDARRDWLHWVGDSVVEWFGNLPMGGCPAPFAWYVHGQQAATSGAVGYKAAGPPYDTTRAFLMPITQNGKSGTGMADLAANVQTRVITPLLNGGLGRCGRPLLVHQCSHNDGGGMNGAAWTALGADAYFDAIAAAVPGVRILMLPIPFGTDGDAWNTGTGTWTATVDSSGTAASNTFYASYAASRGFYFCDWRGTNTSDANTILSGELTTNPTGASVNYTSGGVHPIATYGQKALINFLLPNLSITY